MMSRFACTNHYHQELCHVFQLPKIHVEPFPEAEHKRDLLVLDSAESEDNEAEGDHKNGEHADQNRTVMKKNVRVNRALRKTSEA